MQPSDKMLFSLISQTSQQVETLLSASFTSEKQMIPVSDLKEFKVRLLYKPGAEVTMDASFRYFFAAHAAVTQVSIHINALQRRQDETGSGAQNKHPANNHNRTRAFL